MNKWIGVLVGTMIVLGVSMGFSTKFVLTSEIILTLALGITITCMVV